MMVNMVNEFHKGEKVFIAYDSDDYLGIELLHEPSGAQVRVQILWGTGMAALGSEMFVPCDMLCTKTLTVDHLLRMAQKKAQPWLSDPLWVLVSETDSRRA